MREVAEVHRTCSSRTPLTTARTCASRSNAAWRSATNSSRTGYTPARPNPSEQCLERLDGVDLLLTPTTPFVAPPADTDELTIRDAAIRFTYPFNVLGWPALAIPFGTAENGLPTSVQLAGRPGDDALVLAAGEQLERAASR